MGETGRNMNWPGIYRFMLFPIDEKDTAEYLANVWVGELN